MNDIARQVRTYRQARDWSLAHLAEEAGITEAALRAIESGASVDGLTMVLAALHLEPIEMVVPSQVADYLRSMQPTVAKIAPDQLVITLGRVMSLLGQAAADLPAAPEQQVIAIAEHIDTVIDQ